jgi:hypothetical protein
MHAPATGVIRAIGWPLGGGPKTQAIFLKVYQAANQQVLYDLERDLDAMTPGRSSPRCRMRVWWVSAVPPSPAM